MVLFGLKRVQRYVISLLKKGLDLFIKPRHCCKITNNDETTFEYRIDYFLSDMPDQFTGNEMLDTKRENMEKVRYTLLSSTILVVPNVLITWQ